MRQTLPRTIWNNTAWVACGQNRIEREVFRWRGKVLISLRCSQRTGVTLTSAEWFLTAIRKRLRKEKDSEEANESEQAEGWEEKQRRPQEKHGGEWRSVVLLSPSSDVYCYVTTREHSNSNSVLSSLKSTSAYVLVRSPFSCLTDKHAADPGYVLRWEGSSRTLEEWTHILSITSGKLHSSCGVDTLPLLVLDLNSV